MRTRTVSNRVLPVIGAAMVALAVQAQGAIELPAGTEARIVFEQEVSSKYVKPGDLIPIRLQGDIKVGGIVVVKDGASGTARVKSVKPASKPGKKGEVQVDLVELLPDGSYVPEKDDQTISLEAANGPISAEGKSRKTLSWLLIFGLLIKGTEAVIPADTPYPARVAQDIMLIVD